MNFLNICVFLSIFVIVNGFRLLPSLRMVIKGQNRRNLLKMETESPSSDSWKVDDDSSELEALSSSDLKYIREVESKNLEEMRLAQALVAATKNQQEDDNDNNDSQAVVTTSSSSSSSGVDATVENNFALSSGTDAFDIGLLIAAPIIIGTLGLFFIFPLIKDSIGANLPMPPTS